MYGWKGLTVHVVLGLGECTGGGGGWGGGGKVNLTLKTMS